MLGEGSCWEQVLEPFAVECSEGGGYGSKYQKQKLELSKQKREWTLSQYFFCYLRSYGACGVPAQADQNNLQPVYVFRIAHYMFTESKVGNWG